MIKTGDKLICTEGNGLYTAGELYTVGEFINDKYFELSTGDDGDCWYATLSNDSIVVQFDADNVKCNDARFVTIKDSSHDWLDAYRETSGA